jgi:hypothetical protein
MISGKRTVQHPQSYFLIGEYKEICPTKNIKMAVPATAVYTIATYIRQISFDDIKQFQHPEKYLGLIIPQPRCS